MIGGKWPTGFVVELRPIVTEKCPWIIKEVRDKPPGVPWCKVTFFQRCNENRLADEALNRLKLILSFAEEENLGPTWQETPMGTFVVGDDQQFFKVHANGRIGFPFIRLDAGELFPELFGRLNAALATEQFQPGDENRRKMRDGVRDHSLEALFENREQLGAFLAVWKWFADVRR
jgi:hypothetical protein